MTEKRQTSQGYIIRILQHVMLFQAVMKFLSRLVEIKILVNWGLVHYSYENFSNLYSVSTVALELEMSSLYNNS
jgi:hypothetical protein